MPRKDQRAVEKKCSTCRGKQTVGKDRKGNNIVCPTCHGSGTSIVFVHAR